MLRTSLRLFLVMLSASHLACTSSSPAKVCTTTEEAACTTPFTECTSNAAATADKAACVKCVDDYCACYSACGNTCNKADLNAQSCPF